MGGRGQLSKNSAIAEIRKNATKIATEIKVGKKVAHTDSPLYYGKNDEAVSDEVRQAEAEIRDNEYEIAIVYDANGRVVQRKDGSANRVSGLSEVPEGGILTHNHPYNYSTDAEGVYMGGTLSAGDIAKFRRFGLQGLKTVRATSFEGTYSLTKTPKYNASVMADVEARIDKITKNLNAELTRLGDLKFNTKAWKENNEKTGNYIGLGTWAKQIAKQYEKAQNNAIAEMHNVLLMNQKRGGYTYTLEKRYRKPTKGKE